MVNADFDDLVNDANAARPLTAGGTGGNSQITGWDGLTAQGTAVPSASTILLDTVTGPWIDISGTTTITAVTLGNGKIRLARATGAFQLTASASLIVNNSTSVNYTTTAGDFLIFTAEGGVVRVSAVGSSPAASTSTAGTVKLATLAQTLAQSPAGLVPTIENLFESTGTMSGLTISNNGSSAANKLDLAVGMARDDSDTYNMLVSSAITAKDVTSAWAVGSSAGCLDTGAIGNNVYYIWLIKRVDTGVVDFLVSLSSTSPTMPTNYTVKRLIGKFARVSATNQAPRGYSKDADISDDKWVSYAPTFTGFGTVSGVSFFSRRVGNSLQVAGVFTMGTNTGVTAQISLGFAGTNSNVTVDSTSVPSARILGVFGISSAISSSTFVLGSGSTMTFGISSASIFTSVTGSSFSNGLTMCVNAMIPVQGW